MLVFYKPLSCPERDDLVERIAELKTFIERDSQSLGELKDELSHFDYNKMFNDVTKGEIPWNRLCWPSSSNGGLPERYVCIVCRKGFKKFCGSYQTGAIIGNGLGAPRVHCHEKCMPDEVLSVIKDDLY